MRQVPESMVFKTAAGAMMNTYIEQIRVQVRGWLKNIGDREEPWNTNSDGHVITAAPEDSFNMLNIQIDVAQERLHGIYLVGMVKVCADVLLEGQVKRTADFQTRSTTMDIEELCALVNDSERSQEQCTVLLETVADKLSEEEQDDLSDHMDTTISGFVELAMFGTRLVVGKIFELCQVELFDKCFVGTWLENSFVETAVATFADFFEELEVRCLRNHICSMVFSFPRNRFGFRAISSSRKLSVSVWIGQFPCTWQFLRRRTN